MDKKVKFAVVGDCHYSVRENHGGRDCLGAKRKLSEIIDVLNREELDFVFSVGDLGDGKDACEAIEMLEVFQKSKVPVKFAVGNHDLCTRSDTQHAELVGMPSPSYDFALGGYRFIVLNAFEISRYSRIPEEKQAYFDFRQNNPDVPVQEWPGLFRKSSWEWLSSVLDDTLAKSEDVIVFCHVPAFVLSCLRLPGFTEPPARLVEYQRMLDLLDKYPNVKAYVAGHYHGGGLAVRNDVVHKTLRAICDYAPNTFCIVTVTDNNIRIDGYGAESHFAHQYGLYPKSTN